METPGQKQLFQRRKEKLDWRKLASVDVDKVAREIDVDAIQDNILNVTYCHIEHELGYINLDANFIKLFRLAQLTIEYLLHCQEYLQQCMEEKDLNVKQLNERIQEILAEKENLKDELSKRNSSYKNLKKEFQKSRKMIGDYQLMIRAGASGLHKCICCDKSFVSETYLRSHMERRHAEEAKRLYGSYFSNQQQQQQQPSFRDLELQNELNEIKSRLKLTEDQLKQEREDFSISKMQETEKNREVLEAIRIQHEQWKMKEQSQMKRQMESFKEMMMSELKQSHNEKAILEKNLQELRNTTGKKKSTLGDLMDDDDSNAIPYNELYEKMSGMEANLKQQIDHLQEQHIKQEASTKVIFNKKLSQEKAKRDKLQEQRNKDKRFYEQQIELLKEKLSEHEIMIEKNRTSYVRDEVDAPVYSKPPEPPPRPDSVKSLEAVETMEKDLPEKDSITLWVSLNQNISQESYRVFKQSASPQSEWKDVFYFAAHLKPVGDFQKPVYVYSCAGSPYWRQYLSSSEFPPRPNYKHDFTFFVASSKMIGTFKVFVLDAGSGTVVRSMISKDENVENWKSKGLSFFVMKHTTPKVNISRSGTFNSDVFDSVSDDDDDVSVSSFTGTDVVKQNLVNDIKRSRENLLMDEENEDTKGEMKAEEFDEDKEQEQKDNSEESDGTDAHEGGDSKEVKFLGTSSGSFLSATLPEKGEYYPYPDNPLAVAHYDHSKEMLSGQRKEIQDILDDHLEKRGVDPDEIGMSKKMFLSKIKHHEKESELKEKNFPGFSNYREKLRIALDEFSAREWAKKSKRKTVKKFKTVVGAIKGATKFRSKNKPQEELIYAKDLDEISSTENEYALARYERSASDHDEDEDNNDMEEELSKGENDEDENFSESWNISCEDEEREDELAPQTEMKYSSPDTSPHRYVEQEASYRPKLRSPKGEKVKELAKSLEASLTGRDPSKKKLAGAVDLHNTLEGSDGNEDEKEEGVKPKRSVSFRDTTQYNDNDESDEDDDSDFSLTSFDATASASRRKDDVDKFLDSYQPSASRLGKQKPSSSSTPDVRHSNDDSNKEQQHQTTVTKFSLEDFDDDESF